MPGLRIPPGDGLWGSSGGSSSPTRPAAMVINGGKSRRTDVSEARLCKAEVADTEMLSSAYRGEMGSMECGGGDYFGTNI